jgi:acetylornithine deacetylase
MTEGAIGAFVDERRDDLIALVCDLVAARTPNPPGDVGPAAAIVVDRLRALGIDDVEVMAANASRPNVIARVPGRGGGPTLMLNGHLDTKDPGSREDWETDPWQPAIVNGKLVGVGSADMKGAVAAMVYAAAAVAEAETRGTLALAFTADEESGGPYGPRWLADEGLLSADACVIGEPSGLRHDWEAIRLVSRGAAIFTIRVRGTQMHSSLSDQLPSVNATVEMARLIAAMAAAGNGFLDYEPHPLVERGPTVNIGLTASAGVGYGILAGRAEFLSEVRTLPGMTAAGVEADVRRLLAQLTSDRPELETELELEFWAPATEIPSDHAVVRALQAAAQDVLKRPIPLRGFPGGTDAPHFDRAGIPTVPSFGPGLLTVAHRPNEAISVESVVEAAKVYALAACRYLDT